MSRRPRLLLLTDAFDNRGGGEVIVGHLAGALRERWEVSVLTTTRGASEVISAEQITVYRVHSSYHPRLRPWVAFLNPQVTTAIEAILRRVQPTVVHAWNVHGHLSYDSLRLARRAGAPVVLTFQDAQPFCYSKFKCWVNPAEPCPERPDYRVDPRTCRSCRQHYWLFPPRNRVVRAYLRRFVNRGISVSAALWDALRQNGIPVTGIIYNGLPLDDPALLGADGVRARTRHGWGSGPLVVTGGRLHFFKGQGLAVSAFANVACRRPDARLVVLGERNAFRDGLAAQAAELGIAGRVSFPGFLDRSEYHDVLAAADLFLNLSTYLDPFPTVNLEAMALGVPVVGTCFGGTPEAVVDGASGRIVDPRDQGAVGDAVLALLDEPERRRRLGQVGRERVAGEFAVERMAARYEAIYRELVSGL